MATAKGKRTAGVSKAQGKSPRGKSTPRGGKARTSRRDPVMSSAGVGLIVLAIGVFLLFCHMAQDPNALALASVRQFVNGLFGGLAILADLLVCAFGLQIAFGSRWPVPRFALPMFALILFCVATLLQVFQLDTLMRALKDEGYAQNYNGFLWKSYNASRNTPLGGGFFGALLGYPFAKFLDVLGSVLVLFFAIGGLLLLLIRMVFPAAGEHALSWWDSARASLAERRQERETLMEERAENDALLVPVPKELLEAPVEDMPKKPVAKGRKLAQTAEPAQRSPAAPPVPAPKPLLKPAPSARGAVTPAPANRPALYIEDILPDDAQPAPEPPRVDTAAGQTPDFIAKRRVQYESAYNLQQAAAQADESDAPEQAAEAGQLSIDDAPWETIDPVYAPDTAAPAPRRRRARYETAIDREPQLDPKTRLDRPDWKPEPEEKPAAVSQQPDEYRQPPFSLLTHDESRTFVDTRDQDAQNAEKLEHTLQSFGVEARVVKVVHGPAITRFELQPAPGVKVSRITNLTDDIALNMAAMSVRIEAPIPGKAAVGIEIANDEIETVRLRDVLEGDESIKHPSKLAVALGRDITGRRIIADLARMPHLLIAGQTGSGKSVCINTLITSVIYRTTPEEVRLILIDPKAVELSVYNGIPHLLVPVVTDPKKASGALGWAVLEMEERYKLLTETGVRDIKGYNTQRKADAPLMPQIVIIIDEMADLMIAAQREVEESIQRLAQKARACGIYLVIATQRPSVNVITGVIKANIPSRIAFAVASQIDSRTILDSAGAEKLLGRGDMLYAPSGGGKPTRVQGCFVSDDEVRLVTDYVRDRHTAEYSQAVIEALSTTEEAPDDPDEDYNDASGDALFQQAVEMAVESGQMSISMLQRRLRVGYARAGRLIDEMTRRGVISPNEGTKPREVLISSEDMRLLFKK